MGDVIGPGEYKHQNKNKQKQMYKKLLDNLGYYLKRP